MKKKSALSTFARSKSFPLILILLVMTFITMVISSGVTEGAPFSAMFTDGFLARGNVITVLYSMVIQVIMLCGLGCILISGNIDLSVGGQAALSTLVFAWLCKYTQMPWGVALIITFCVALCFGLINAFLVNKLRFPAFIATIGMSSIYRGLCSVMTKGDNIQIARASFTAIGKTNLFGFLPVSFVFALVVLAIFQFMLSYTRFGRSIFMVGGNQQAARLSGLNPDRVRLVMFLLNSLLACVGPGQAGQPHRHHRRGAGHAGHLCGHPGRHRLHRRRRQPGGRPGGRAAAEHVQEHAHRHGHPHLLDRVRLRLRAGRGPHSGLRLQRTAAQGPAGRLRSGGRGGSRRVLDLGLFTVPGAAKAAPGILFQSAGSCAIIEKN